MRCGCIFCEGGFCFSGIALRMFFSHIFADYRMVDGNRSKIEWKPENIRKMHILSWKSTRIFAII